MIDGSAMLEPRVLEPTYIVDDGAAATGKRLVLRDGVRKVPVGDRLLGHGADVIRRIPLALLGGWGDGDT